LGVEMLFGAAGAGIVGSKAAFDGDCARSKGAVGVVGAPPIGAGCCGLLMDGCNLAGGYGAERAGWVVGEGDQDVVAFGSGERGEIAP
jgi:hypothetical protein